MENEKEESRVLSQEEMVSKMLKLEKEITAIMDQKNNKSLTFQRTKDVLKSFFSRNNLELFLSLVSLAISLCIAAYLSFK